MNWKVGWLSNALSGTPKCLRIGPRCKCVSLVVGYPSESFNTHPFGIHGWGVQTRYHFLRVYGLGCPFLPSRRGGVSVSFISSRTYVGWGETPRLRETVGGGGIGTPLSAQSPNTKWGNPPLKWFGWTGCCFILNHIWDFWLFLLIISCGSKMNSTSQFLVSFRN